MKITWWKLARITTQKFAVAAKEKGTSFRRSSRKDPEWVFTIQTAVVGKDNTVAIADRRWQIHMTRTLAGCTVTIHAHLGGGISISYCPNVVARSDGPENRQLS